MNTSGRPSIWTTNSFNIPSSIIVTMSSFVKSSPHRLFSLLTSPLLDYQQPACQIATWQGTRRLLWHSAWAILSTLYPPASKTWLRHNTRHPVKLCQYCNRQRLSAKRTFLAGNKKVCRIGSPFSSFFLMYVFAAALRFLSPQSIKYECDVPCSIIGS